MKNTEANSNNSYCVCNLIYWKCSTRLQELLKLFGGRNFFQSTERKERNKKTWQNYWFNHHSFPWSVDGKLIPIRKSECQQCLVCIYIVYHNLGHVFSFLPTSNTSRNQRGKNHSGSQWLRNASIPHTLCWFSPIVEVNTLSISMSQGGEL